jgi:periplasmic protein TonB
MAWEHEAGTAQARPTANDRLKARFGDMLWYSVAGAAVLHLALFAFFPNLTAADMTGRMDELVAIELPPEVVIPPPPEQIARPATPVISNMDIDDDVTIPPTTFEAHPVDRLPPPPTTSGAAGDLADGPRYVPMTVVPELLNKRELEQLLRRHYPPMLQQAGVNGTPVLWFFIDTDGRVLQARLHTSSGYAQLDEAALRIAPEMRFSPAMNRDKRVQVWVEIPIAFSSR